MRPVHLLLTVLLVAGAPSVAAAAEPPALATARVLYNAADYEGAIDAASVARLESEWSDAAALVIGRSHLERYRRNADPSDLASARETLGGIRAAALNARDQIDLLIGLGQALYLAELFGASAELFETALARAFLMEDRDRLMLLDWWATALDREAQSRPTAERAGVFTRILTRMEQELHQDAASPVANYWLAVAARGVGNIERAWSAAVAAWLRAGLAPDTAQQLRADIDRLVTQALIPERARARAGNGQPDAIAGLTAEWELVRQQWK
jgi:hypothetical protein